MEDNLLEIYVDGASRGNPGPAAWAYIYVNKGNIIHQKMEFVGRKTNNTAEYLAIINALKDAQEFTGRHLRIFSDSELAIKQINKKYKINKQHLSKLCDEVYRLRKNYNNVDFLHVSRNNPFIQQCDKLCNDCLDQVGF